MRSRVVFVASLALLVSAPIARAEHAKEQAKEAPKEQEQEQEVPWAHAWARIAEVRQLLEAWREAQNGVDEAAYQALYDEAFVGVGKERATSFPRAPPRSDAEEIPEIRDERIFAGGPDVMRAVFTAPSRGGHDDGVRQIIWRKRPSQGWRIVREMLPAAARASAPPAWGQAAAGQPVEGQSVPGGAAFLQFALMWDREVVVANPADDAWAASRPRFSPFSKASYYRELERKVNRRKLLAQIRALLGQRLQLLDAAGRVVCETKVTGFALRARVTGADDVAKDAWDMGAKALLATLDAAGKRCKNAKWARSAELPALAWVPAVEPDAALSARAVAAFRALPATVEVTREDDEWVHVRLPGETRGDRMPTPAVRFFAGMKGAPSFVSVSVQGDAPCNEPSYDFWALWEVKNVAGGPPDLVLRNQPDRWMYVLPTAAIYLDGEKAPTLLFDHFHDHAASDASGQPQFLEGGWVRPLEGDYVDFSGLANPSYVCPC